MKRILDILNRIFAVGMLALGIFACVFFSYFGTTAIANENLLREKGIETVAEVTNRRPDTNSRRSVDYQIQYQFTVEQGGIRYSFADDLGRQNLWYSPSPAEWNTIQETNRIWIVYLPDNPWLNRPVDSTPMLDSICAAALGPMAGVLCLLGIAVYVKRRLRLNYYRNDLRPETIDAIAYALQRIQSEGGNKNFVFFTLGKDLNYWIQCTCRPGAHTVSAEAADNKSLRQPFALNQKQLSCLQSLGWNRPNMRKPNHYHREWWAGNDGDRRRIACEIMQTFHEVYGLDLDLPPVVHLGIADEAA